MEGFSRLYYLLYNELEKIETQEIETELLYLLNKETGEFVPIAESIPSEADSIVKYIKKQKTKQFNFVFTWQQPQHSVASMLNGNSLKLLQFLTSKMQFDNCVFGITHRVISTYLNMSSRTVIRAVKELEEFGVIMVTGKKGNKVYHVNPAYAWKGSFNQMKTKLKMFKKVMQESDIWKKN